MSEAAATRAGRNLPTLTGLRWFAAFAVFGSHTVILLTGTAEQAVRAVFDHGRVGVSFFFILSGFIVTWALRDTDTAKQFWRRRFARIYPAYLVSLIAAVIFWKAIGTDQRPDALLSTLFLVQSWIPSRDFFFAGNDVGWSLSCEAFFYAAFPALVLGLRRLDITGRRIVQAATVVVAIAVGVWATVTMPDNYFGVGGPAVYVAYVLPIVRALEFTLGITLALDACEGRRAPLGWRPAAVLALVAYVAAQFAPTGLDFAAITIVPFALLVRAAAQEDLAGRATTPGNRWVVMLGEWSFCFYLVHRLVLLVILHARGEVPAGGPMALALILGGFVVSLAAAWALHSWVEKPMYRRLAGRRVTLPVSMRDEKAPI